MRIDLAQTPNIGLPGRTPGLIPEWRVGAILEATAIRDATTGQLWLKIGHARYPARLASGDPQGPAPGETLQLRVLRNSPVVALETLAAGTATAAEDAGDALRRLLPRQSSPAALLANAAWATQPGADRTLPASVASALARLWRELPTTVQLVDAGGLKAALQRSGLFLESQLAASVSSHAARELAGSDLKALYLTVQQAATEQGGRQRGTQPSSPAPLPMLQGSLLPLAEVSPSLPGAPAAARLDTLASQAEGTLARLTATQLINVAANGLACLIELPVRHDDAASVLRFRFEQEPREAGDREPGWAVEVVLTVATAAVHARVGFRSGQVSVQLRSDSAALVDRLKPQMAVLATALQSAGLEVGQVICLHGLPAADPGQAHAQLVNARA